MGGLLRLLAALSALSLICLALYVAAWQLVHLVSW